MKKCRVSVFTIMVLSISIFTTCVNDGENIPGFFTYDGNTYYLDNTFSKPFSENTNGTYTHHLKAYSLSVIDDGIGHGFWLHIVSDFWGPYPGTYNWSDNLTAAEIFIDYNFNEESGFSRYATSGIVTIRESVINNGTVYTIEFSLSLDDGKATQGSYTTSIEEKREWWVFK